MEEVSAMTLDRVEQNDATLHSVSINGANSSEELLARLGSALGGNTHVVSISVSFRHGPLEDAMHGNRTFFEGLRRNTSIDSLLISHGHFAEEICVELLDEFVENNVNLTSIHFNGCSLTGWASTLASAVASCRNMRRLSYAGLGGDDAIKEMVSTRMLHHLREVKMFGVHLSIVGFRSLSDLLQDAQCGLTSLTLQFTTEGSMDDAYAEILADSLRRNKKLKSFGLHGLSLDENGWEDFAFSALCDFSDIGSTYLSNHTLRELQWGFDNMSTEVEDLLQMNDAGPDEASVAMKKILLYHHLDMEPFLHLDLKVLPLAVNWFDKAATLALPESICGNVINVEAGKLSAIYQFARSLPLMFVPSKNGATKRKIDGLISGLGPFCS